MILTINFNPLIYYLGLIKPKEKKGKSILIFTIMTPIVKGFMNSFQMEYWRQSRVTEGPVAMDSFRFKSIRLRQGPQPARRYLHIYN